MNFDLTPIFEGIIALLAALITYKLIPWIKGKTTAKQFENLKTAAKIAVMAAEQIYSHGDNETKLEAALMNLQNAGFNLDYETLRAAVEQAVYEIKGEQQIAEVFSAKHTQKEETENEKDGVDTSSIEAM